MPLTEHAAEGPVALIVSHDRARAATLAALALETGCTPVIIDEAETGAGALTSHQPAVALVDAEYAGELANFFFQLAREMAIPIVIAAADLDGTADPRIVSFALGTESYEAHGRDGIMKALFGMRDEG
jgi:DNA-binding response OmpR family regulator